MRQGTGEAGDELRTGRRPIPCPMTGPPSPSSAPHSGRCPSPTPRSHWPARPRQLRVGDEVWDHLASIAASGRFATELSSAFANGRALLDAPDGLRGRTPLVIEWTGGRRPPGDEVAPIDLRIDHVYLISCKYESDILANASPARLFDGLLATVGNVGPHRLVRGGRSRRVGRPLPVLPGRDRARPACRRHRRSAVGKRSDGCATPWAAGPTRTPSHAPPTPTLCRAVSHASARRWAEQLESSGIARETMLWRLLRIGSAPYFVLGHDRRTGLPARYRIASPWDWREQFELSAFSVSPSPGRTAPGRLDLHLPVPGRRRRTGGRRPRRDPLEPRPLRPATGSEGLSRHPHVVTARVPPVGRRRPAAAHPVAGRPLIPWSDGTAARTSSGSTRWPPPGPTCTARPTSSCGWHPATVLDAGCGTGRVARELARRGVDTVGVDLDRSMIDTARQLAPDLTWVLGDIAESRPRPCIRRGGDGRQRPHLHARRAPTPPWWPDVPATSSPGAAWSPDSSSTAGYALATYDEHCRQAGLTAGGRWATWSGAPFDDGGHYAVSVHRRPSERSARRRPVVGTSPHRARRSISAIMGRPERTPCEIPCSSTTNSSPH